MGDDALRCQLGQAIPNIPFVIHDIPMFKHILVICTGNICRSPMAEVLLRHTLEQAGHSATVRSAGTAALADFPADDPAHALMQEKGLDISTHRACQVTQEHTRQADLILVMEQHHREYILALDPSARGKTFLLGHWTKQDIPDPYKQGMDVYGQVLSMIENAVQLWAGKIAPQR
jgi:protein-tyrosine phosphatase